MNNLASGYGSNMNPPVRDTGTRITAGQASPPGIAAGSQAGSDFWDAAWTLDDEWQPESTPFGGDAGLPDFLMIL